jgi:fumarylacetoacetase
VTALGTGARAASWLAVPEGSALGPQTLPYGVFTTSGDDRPRVGVAIGRSVLDLTAATAGTPHARLFQAGSLVPLLSAGRPVWREVRERVGAWVVDEGAGEELAGHLVPADAVRLHLPFPVADYVDFYSNEHHAANVGRMFRPDGEPLTPNWKHLPIGYHGRAGTVVVSGSPVPRPSGQRRAGDGSVVFGPSQRLDIEVELGFVVGTPSARGRGVGLDDLRDHVFGAVLVNDWSARDLQAWEYVPLGPFLGKSFATSVGAWVVPLDALDAAHVEPPPRDPRPLPYLDDTGLPPGPAGSPAPEPWGLDITFEVRLNGHVISRPPFATMYWTPAQQLAHLTVNGASLRTGDLFASGTVSGPDAGQRGSLLELTWNGRDPLPLPDGTTRTFLEDGDEVVITATAPGPGGTRVGLGEVRGTVTP